MAPVTEYLSTRRPPPVSPATATCQPVNLSICSVVSLPLPKPDGFEDLAAVDDVPEGTLLAVTKSNGEPVCLFNQHGAIGAVHDICTHAEFLMSDGELLPDGTIECAWHGARFDCITGRVCRGPASEPLPVYDVRLQGARILVSEGAEEEA